MTPMSILSGYCHICRGERQSLLSGTKRVCVGCGTPIANAFTQTPQKQKPTRMPCPKCGSHRVHWSEPGRYRCDLCSAIFEPLDRTRLQWDFAHMYSDGYELMAWSMFEALRASGLFRAEVGTRYGELLSTYRTPSVTTTASGSR